MGDAAAAGDTIPAESEIIEVRVAELRQLFNAIDPSPFRERDLDPNAEAFIVGWASEMDPEKPVALLVHLERSPGSEDEAGLLRDAVHEYFAERGASTRRRLRQLLRRGRTSLLIGLVFLALSLLVSDLVANALSERPAGVVLRESLLIGGWVAMWRPMEIFLYDWWPILQEARLFDRLSVMPVRIAYAVRKGDSNLGSHRLQIR